MSGHRHGNSSERSCNIGAGSVIPSSQNKERVLVSVEQGDDREMDVTATLPKRRLLGSACSPTISENHGKQPQRHRRKSRMLQELEDHNSPPTRSESPASFSTSKDRVSARGKKPHRKDGTNMQKELASFNDDTQPDAMIGFLTDSGIRNTRRTTRFLTKLLNNQELPKERTLNELQLAGLATATKEENRDFETEEETDEDNDDDSNFLGSRSPMSVDTDVDATIDENSEHETKAISASSVAVNRGVRRPTRRPINFNIISKQPELAPSVSWDQWHRDKQQVNALLETPRYAVSPVRTLSNQAEQPAYQPLIDIPDGYNFHMDNGTVTFAPTLEVFRDFGPFLSVVEEIAGRKNGCVKIIVPEGASTPTGPQAVPRANLMLPSQLIRGSKKSLQSQAVVAYHIEQFQTASQPASCYAIEQHRREVVEGWALNPNRWVDAWKDVTFEDSFKEAKMVEYLSSQDTDLIPKASFHEPASHDLRVVLDLDDPELAKLSGNRLHESMSTLVGYQSSQLEVAHSKGVPNGLHCKDFATYSISYLHKGAPKCWTIIRPKHHAKLEETLHFLTAQHHLETEEGVRAKEPPQCDQFIRHQALYLPQATLELFNVEFSVVAQHQNEMLITFPYAYCQAYSTGPNIVEEMAYASRRWEVFHKKQLYHPCGSKCSQRAPALDLTFIRTSHGRAAGFQPRLAKGSSNLGDELFDGESGSSASDQMDWEGDDGDWSESGNKPSAPARGGRGSKHPPSSKTFRNGGNGDAPRKPAMGAVLPPVGLFRGVKRATDQAVVGKVDDLFSSMSKRQRIS